MDRIEILSFDLFMDSEPGEFHFINGVECRRFLKRQYNFKRLNKAQVVYCKEGEKARRFVIVLPIHNTKVWNAEITTEGIEETYTIRFVCIKGIDFVDSLKEALKHFEFPPDSGPDAKLSMGI